MNDSKTFGRISVLDDGWSQTIRIKKKYEWAMIGFFVFVIAFILGMSYLLRIAEANQEERSDHFFLIMNLIIKGIGGILFVAMVYELLKREFIVLIPGYLVLKYKVAGIDVRVRKYDRALIHDIEQAPAPEKGWRQTDSYRDSSRSTRTYSNDTRKVYPGVQFTYKKPIKSALGDIISAFPAENKEQHGLSEERVNYPTVAFANGLDPAEANFLIQLITSQK